jgi:Cu+-exporting ATPase
MANAASTVDLSIEGMTCASCVTRVERALTGVPGVAQASVNLASHRAHVALNDNVDPQALVAAVEDIGYDAALLAPERDARAEAAAREARAQKAKRDAILAFALSAPFIAGMIGDLFGRHWMPPPAVQLAFAAPVQVWLGARFYRAAWKSLRVGVGTMDLLVALGTTAAFGGGRPRRPHAAPLLRERRHRHRLRAARQMAGGAGDAPDRGRPVVPRTARACDRPRRPERR